MLVFDRTVNVLLSFEVSVDVILAVCGVLSNTCSAFAPLTRFIKSATFFVEDALILTLSGRTRDELLNVNVIFVFALLVLNSTWSPRLFVKVRVATLSILLVGFALASQPQHFLL